MNSVNVIGRLCWKPELKRSGNGTPMAFFTVAVQRDRDNADFVPCQAWRETAEKICGAFDKGDRIGLSGSIVSWKKDEKTEVAVNVFRFDFLEPKKAGPPTQGPQPTPEDEPVFDEDLPF